MQKSHIQTCVHPVVKNKMISSIVTNYTSKSGASTHTVAEAARVLSVQDPIRETADVAFFY